MKSAAYVLLLIATWAMMFWVLTGVYGCAANHAVAPQATTRPVLPHPGQTPTELVKVASGLDHLIILGVLAVGVGIGLYFFVPEAHSLSVPLVGVAGSVQGAALILRVSLWFIPWIAAGLVVAGIGALIYELHVQRHKVAKIVAPVLGEAKSVYDGFSPIAKDAVTKISSATTAAEKFIQAEAKKV